MEENGDMNEEEIKKLKNKIMDFQGQDVFVAIQQAIQYNTTIYKAKVIVSNERLIISDGENQDFIVELQYLENVDIEGNTIDLEMSNCIKISLDC
jgi:hypothetical protein